jgi:hypothetical protein
MLNKNSSTVILLILFCLSTLFPPCEQLLAAETKKQQPVPEQTIACCGPEDYVDITPAVLPFFQEKEPGVFDLARYYDDIEPPKQGGVLGRYTILGEDVLYFAAPAFLVLATIYLLPEDVSNWDRDEIDWEHGSKNWPENVSNWQWDSDDDWINYIGHPFFGSAYYVYARHYGFSRMESFLFSFSASAFYEIGLEAWAEPVSIQDVIFTPLLGAGLAELLLPLEYRIQQNDNKVLNSRILGAVSLFLIDPFGHIVQPFKKLTQSFFSRDTAVHLTPVYAHHDQVDQQGRATGSEERYGLILTFSW